MRSITRCIPRKLRPTGRSGCFLQSHLVTEEMYRLSRATREETLLSTLCTKIRLAVGLIRVIYSFLAFSCLASPIFLERGKEIERASVVLIFVNCLRPGAPQGHPVCCEVRGLPSRARGEQRNIRRQRRRKRRWQRDEHRKKARERERKREPSVAD